jgi:anthranilate phosphoribosyltransferase
MLKPYLEKLITQQNLSAQEAEAAVDLLTQSDNVAQTAAFLVLLRAKQETSAEIFGLVKGMRKHDIKVTLDYPVLDIAGTGGDGANTINISTGASILAASCGVPVLKHGGRRSTSHCGTADVLEALGVNINLQAAQVKSCLAQASMAFCFAPNFHPAMKKNKEARVALGIRTAFNILGPLLNPADNVHLMMGVFDENLLPPVADVLFNLGAPRSMVFHGCGLDELSCIGPANVIEVTATEKKAYQLDPRAFGFSVCTLEDLRGSDAQQNAQTLRAVFAGNEGPIADTLIFNAATALYIYGKSPSITVGIKVVRENIQNGNAQRVLQQLIKTSNEV